MKHTTTNIYILYDADMQPIATGNRLDNMIQVMIEEFDPDYGYEAIQSINAHYDYTINDEDTDSLCDYLVDRVEDMLNTELTVKVPEYGGMYYIGCYEMMVVI